MIAHLPLRVHMHAVLLEATMAALLYTVFASFAVPTTSARRSATRPARRTSVGVGGEL